MLFCVSWAFKSSVITAIVKEVICLTGNTQWYVNPTWDFTP